jgi:hypothetical protein
MLDTDSVFNYVIFLIPIAILVSRFVNRARAKNAPPPKKPPQPYIPVHFEDDGDDDDSGYFKNRAAAAAADAPQRAQVSRRKTQNQKTIATPFTPKPEFFEPIQPSLAAAKTVAVLHPPRPDFTFSFNHLSPLKQAVVMSEILGQPKGIS